jgi:hypothetical protein
VKVYLIDDRTDEKAKYLAPFLLWLGDSFPPYQFEAGFADPKRASEDAVTITKALRDNDGLILLDLFMEGQFYEEAAEQLLESHPNCVDRREAIWSSLRHAAHQDGITKLAATVATLAEHYSTRLAWISNDSRVAAVLAQFYHLENPKLPWEGAWSESERKDLEPLIDNFRKPYLDAAKAWSEMNSKLCQHGFLFPRNSQRKNMLFPVDGSYGHNPVQHLECSELLATNRAAVSDIVNSFLQLLAIQPVREIDDYVRIYFLKFASRCGQVHLHILPSLFGDRVSMQEIEMSDGIACEASGPLILAIKGILSDSCATVSFENIAQTVCMKIVFPTDDPQDTHRMLSMKPGQRMKGPPARATPGICVVALDYIGPDSLITGQREVIATKSFTKVFAR